MNAQPNIPSLSFPNLPKSQKFVRWPCINSFLKKTTPSIHSSTHGVSIKIYICTTNVSRVSKLQFLMNICNIYIYLCTSIQYKHPMKNETGAPTIYKLVIILYDHQHGSSSIHITPLIDTSNQNPWNSSNTRKDLVTT